MKGPRTITIVCHDGNHFDVHEGEAYADRLCWDEMLGQIASMTHPSINKARYSLMTPEEHVQRRERWRQSHVPAVEGDAA